MGSVALGIMVHNEARNLEGLLSRLSRASCPGHRVDPIVVISSGSTDGSGEIARAWARRDARIRVIEEPARRGKAAAINRFLEVLPERTGLCVLISGDVLPEDDALAHLLAPFAHPSVGMTGARPRPTNPERGLLNRVVHFQWSVHHRVACRRPKLGELVAFRAVLERIPPESAVDEATLEALLVRRGYRLVYVPAARVHNRGPDNVREYLEQRRRIWVGHLWLWRRTGYRVSTFGPSDLWRPLAEELLSRPGRIPSAVVAGGLELVARVQGTRQHLFGGEDARAWPPLPSTKQPAPPATPPPGAGR